MARKGTLDRSKNCLEVMCFKKEGYDASVDIVAAGISGA